MLGEGVDLYARSLCCIRGLRLDEWLRFHGPTAGIVTKKATKPTRLPREPKKCVKRPRERRDHTLTERVHTPSSPLCLSTYLALDPAGTPFASKDPF